jgi:hydroxyethylthiazole kinase-like uncharacterized protein yjeF
MSSKYIMSREMRAIEVNCEYFGVSLLQLMENAGHNVAIEVSSRCKLNQKIAIFSGLGGNGGDGFVAARHLSAMGFKVNVVLAGKGKDIAHEAALQNWVALQHLRDNISIHEVTDSSAIPTIEADVVVDALLGTGSKGKLKPLLSKIVDYINSLKATVIAVDVPTGIDSDTGDILGNAVKAEVTVTFYKAKKGLETAKKYAGEVVVRDIGLPPTLEAFAGPGDVLLATKPRASTAHKGDSGRLLVIGGSEIFSGAPALMSLAALRTGVDIVFTATPEKTAHDIASMSPDLIIIKLDGNNLKPSNLAVLKDYIQNVDAVVLGPGLGLNPETKKFVKEAVEAIEAAGKPLLLDADGLKVFAEFKRPLKVPLVLTPHAKEYAILAGKKLPEPTDLAGRIKAIKQTATELGAVLLVKGETDIISDGKRVKLNFTGNAGMSVGGTGDVLSGVVGALLAQKVDAFEAAVAGAFVNGATGDFVAEEAGNHMLASDLLNWIPIVLNDPMSHLKVQKHSGKTA